MHEELISDSDEENEIEIPYFIESDEEELDSNDRDVEADTTVDSKDRDMLSDGSFEIPEEGRLEYTTTESELA